MMSLVVPGFDLEQIYKAGQAIRWQKLRLVDNLYYVIVSNRNFTAIEQKKNRLIFTCSSNNVYDYWFEYLDLRQDYVELNADMHRTLSQFAKMSDDSFGLHVLKLEVWEVMLAVLAMRKSSPESARMNMDLLCSIAGKKHESAINSIRFVWHETPDSEDIVKHSEELLKYEMFKPVVDLAEKVDIIGEFMIEAMALDSNGKNMQFLRSLEVFKPQEARIIMSWGLGRRDVIALSKTQGAMFTRKFGSSPLDWMRSNKYVRDHLFHGRMDYFSQLVRSSYISKKQKELSEWE